MNIKLLFWIVGLFLGAIIIGVLWHLWALSDTGFQIEETGTTLPISGSTGSGGNTSGSVSSAGEGKFVVLAQDGGAVITNDFLNNGITVKDTANSNRYLLAGDLETCWVRPEECRATSATDFNVYYNAGPQSFTIALTEEPLGQARVHMEDFMLSTLGITREQMCSLNYLVTVPIAVNEQYAGNNLGFSFCPGATVLP